MAWLSPLANLFLSRKQAFRHVFSGREGDLVLALILRECQLDRDAAVPGDAISTGERIGRQNVARFIQNAMHLPDAEIVRRANNIPQEYPEDGIESHNDQV